MDFCSRARAGLLSWTHGIPLPSADQATLPKFQFWHQFDPIQQWVPTCSNIDSSDQADPKHEGNTSDLQILTWNIDATSPRTKERATEIITFITELDSEVDIIFLQEVSRPALQQILQNDRIREFWFSSERDDTAWGHQSFATMTLLSRSRFSLNSNSKMRHASLGPVWRIKYPSRFERDALCCDIFVPSPNTECATTRVRLVNVHLDSLPIRPSFRPQQISIVSSFIHAAGCGLVAGDFNPVLDEDATLIESNGLTDAWASLHPKDSGYTWGTDGKQLFPPARLDKIALLGLSPHKMKTLEPKSLVDLDTSILSQTPTEEDRPVWSDHHGLLCYFSLAE
jgi:tyrosyl-DNA phosphodiesterase 2